MRILLDALERGCEEPDLLGVGRLGPRVVDNFGDDGDRGVLRGTLDFGTADGVLGRGLGPECISCRSAEELLLLCRGAVDRFGPGVARLGVLIFGVDLGDGLGAEKDFDADGGFDRGEDPPRDRDWPAPEPDWADDSPERILPLNPGGPA